MNNHTTALDQILEAIDANIDSTRKQDARDHERVIADILLTLEQSGCTHFAECFRVRVRVYRVRYIDTTAFLIWDDIRGLFALNA